MYFQKLRITKIKPGYILFKPEYVISKPVEEKNNKSNLLNQEKARKIKKAVWQMGKHGK